MIASSNQDSEAVFFVNFHNTVIALYHYSTFSNFFFQEVDLTHCQLRGVPTLVTRLNRVAVLCLRQNRISNITPLSDLVTLEELDLYYNELKTIHGLEKLTNLTCVHRSILDVNLILQAFKYYMFYSYSSST